MADIYTHSQCLYCGLEISEDALNSHFHVFNIVISWLGGVTQSPGPPPHVL